MCHQGSNQIHFTQLKVVIFVCLQISMVPLISNYKMLHCVIGELCLMPTKQHWLVKKTTQSFHAKPSRLFYSHRGSVWQKFYSACTCTVYSKFWFCDWYTLLGVPLNKCVVLQTDLILCKEQFRSNHLVKCPRFPHKFSFTQGIPFRR